MLENYFFSSKTRSTALFTPPQFSNYKGSAKRRVISRRGALLSPSRPPLRAVLRINYSKSTRAARWIMRKRNPQSRPFFRRSLLSPSAPSFSPWSRARARCQRAGMQHTAACLNFIALRIINIHTHTQTKA